jgi:hypothetical protein
MRPIALAATLLLMSACATPPPEEVSEDPTPAAPQPTASQLREGLAVDYYYGTFDHVRDLVSFMAYKDGDPGAPLTSLSHDDGAAKVLTSAADDLVGAHITGYLRLRTPGTYRFQVTTNDGVRLHLGGARIHDDPGTGPARTSDPIPVQVTEPGWYPLELWYFEKRGTSTLRIAWSPPGQDGMSDLPADVLRH